jgi:4-hydroxybenzoate polyprenyltransferase
MEYLKAYYRVCRLEYLPGEIPAVFTVLFLGSATISRFFDFLVVEALIVFILLYLSGFIINALTDKDIDQKYDTFKTSIPKSVDTFGEGTVKAMVVSHVLIAIVLGFHISMQMSSFIPIALVLLGVFFGIGYSLKPFHFKVRGIWHAIALGSSAFFLPFIFLMFVITDGLITLPLMIFILGFSFVHYGMEFGNQAIDFIEDRDSNVRTPPVRWGMIPSLIIAQGCVVFGITAEAASLYYILLTKGSFTYIHPILTTNVVYVLLMSIIIAGYVIPTKGLWKMLWTLKKTETVEEGMPTLKKICNYAKWQTSGILGIAVVSAILFFGVTFSPITNSSDNAGYGSVTDSVLGFATPPEIEFYEDNDGGWANVSISVLNDNNQREYGSLRTMVQALTANIPRKTVLIHLEERLAPNEYWNISTQISVPDVYSTTLKIYILEDQSGYGDFQQVGKPWIEPSRKKIYIYDATAEGFEDLLKNKKANVTVSVYNEDYKRGIGDLEVEVWYYYLGVSNYESERNENVVSTNVSWTPKLTIDAVEFDDISDIKPYFIVYLYDVSNGEHNYLDEISFSGYS